MIFSTVFIYFDSKLLVPVFYFDDPVQTSFWAVRTEQPYTVHLISAPNQSKGKKVYHIRESKSLLYKYILWFSLSLHKDKVGLENSYDIHRFRVLQVYPNRIFTWHPIHQNYWNHAHKIETLIWTWFEIFYELSYPELHDLRNSYYTITQFLEFNKTEKPFSLQGCTILKTAIWLLCN